LAGQVVNHGQTLFYLERLQFDWLPQGQRRAIRVCCRLVFGLVVGLSFGLVLVLGSWLVASRSSASCDPATM
jgi:hypothetical protein